MLYAMPAPLSMRRRWQIVGMSRAGARSARIAHVLGATRKTVCKILRLYREMGNVQPSKSTGHPRKTTERQDCLLVRMARMGCANSASTLRREFRQATNVNVSRETINKRLVKSGYRARRPIVKPRLLNRHKVQCLHCAREHRALTV